MVNPIISRKEIIVEPDAILKDGRRKNWFWDNNDVFESDLSSNAILVRLYIARCANGERQAWPSLNTIAKHCKISKPTVIKALKELEEKGWLEKIIRKSPNQEYMTTIYILKDPPVYPFDLDKEGGKADLPPVKTKTGGDKGGGKTDLPPVKNETGKSRGVVNDVYHLVNQVDNLVKQVDPNNTQLIIPTEQENNKLIVSSLRSDTINSASAFQADRAAGGSITPENKTDERDSHPRAGAANAAGKGNRENDQERGTTGVDEIPSSKELIAELVKEYRAVEGVEETRGDYPFIGALYNRYSYDQILEAIHELNLAASVQEIKKPLLYLKAIVQAIAQRSNRAGKISALDTGRKIRRLESGMSNWSTCEDEEKRREMLRSLYLS